MKPEETLKFMVLRELQESVDKLIASSSNVESVKVKTRIEYSRDEKFGDYSTPFAMENKAIFGKNPMEIAVSLAEILKSSKLFSEVSTTNPGFINMRISDDVMKDYVKEHFLKKVDIFAVESHPEKIHFEFVSANPTGPLNIVSARSAAAGDSICRLLESAGHKVHREYYVNDYGNQIHLLGISCLARIREIQGETLLIQKEDQDLSEDELYQKNYIPAEGYRGDYLIHTARTILEDKEFGLKINQLIQDKKYREASGYLAKKAVEVHLLSHRKDLENFKVHFNQYFSETSLHEAGKPLEVLKLLEEKGQVYEDKGKKVFRSTSFGDDKDRVLVREDGRPTYLLADIAYHREKTLANCNRIIDIWGPDHHGYIARLKGAVKSLGFPEDKFQILIAQQVNLLAKGEKVKMSKRQGKFQSMQDLEEFLGENFVDVARYFFIMRSLDAPLDFDLELAGDESEKNPVFYIQYAHARIASIFRESGDQFNIQDFSILEMDESRRRLLFWICRISEEVLDASRAMEAHRLATYLQNLSKAFTKFYQEKNNRIKGSDEQVRSSLTALCYSVKMALQNGLNLLGIKAPDNMKREQP